MALLVVVLLWSGARWLQTSIYALRKDWPAEADSLILPPAKHARAIFSPLGGSQVWSDIVFSAGTAYSEGKQAMRSRHKYLDNLLDIAITLDPGFYRPYKWATEYYLAFYRFETALKYARLGMQRFRDREVFPKLAGEVYWFDLATENPKQKRCYQTISSELMELSMSAKDTQHRAGRALWTSMRFTLVGKREHAIKILEEALLSTQDESKRKQLVERLALLAPSQAEYQESLHAAVKFTKRKNDRYPFIDDHLFTLFSHRVNRQIDFDRLALDRDLVGALIIDLDDLQDDDYLADKPAKTITEIASQNDPADYPDFDCAGERDWIFGRTDTRPVASTSQPTAPPQ